MQRPPTQSNAFTLIEMSIVLVVIGLIVGAVFAGNAMLQQSKLQSVLSDYAKYTQAVAQFRQQYKAIPGDMLDATNYWGKDNANCPGAPDSAATPGTCNGDADGMLNSLSEELRAWQQLQLANLILGVYSGVGAQIQIGYNIPGSRITGAGWTFWTNTTVLGTAYFYNQDMGTLLTFGGAPTGAGLSNSWYPVLTPAEAQQIDKKIDDGFPATGRIMTIKPSYSPDANCSTSSTDALALYNEAYKGAACSLMMSLNLEVSQH